MFVNNLRCGNINFLADNKEPPARKIAAGALMGALVVPCLPLIDGDGFKEIYTNRKVLKSVSGSAMVGAAIASAKVLSDKYADNPTKKIIQYSTLGALFGYLLSKVDYWAQINKKSLSKKLSAAIILTGAALGGIVGCLGIREKL